MVNLSILVPIYNEEHSIEGFVRDLAKSMKNFDESFEIIFIDDGSSDKSLHLLKKEKVDCDSIDMKILVHPYNIGYGAALKTGLRKASGEWICIIDADMTYSTGSILDLYRMNDNCEMVVAARTGEKVSIPFLRRPAKWLITKLACYLTGFKIPDLNSGLRIFRKDIAMKFFGLFPSRFSFTTTITLACLTNDYRVKYLPINYNKRIGKSSIKPHHFFDFIILIFRIVMYFKPLKFFFWPAFVFMLTGAGIGTYGAIYQFNIPDSALLLMITGFQLFVMGVIADLIVKNRYVA